MKRRSETGAGRSSRITYMSDWTSSQLVIIMKPGPPIAGPYSAIHGPGKAAFVSDSTSASSASVRGPSDIAGAYWRLLLFACQGASELASARVLLCATSSAARAVDQSRSEALTGIIGARRACTVSMISPLSMPWR